MNSNNSQKKIPKRLIRKNIKKGLYERESDRPRIEGISNDYKENALRMDQKDRLARKKRLGHFFKKGLVGYACLPSRYLRMKEMIRVKPYLTSLNLELSQKDINNSSGKLLQKHFYQMKGLSFLTISHAQRISQTDLILPESVPQLCSLDLEFDYIDYGVYFLFREISSLQNLWQLHINFACSPAFSHMLPFENLFSALDNLKAPRFQIRIVDRRGGMHRKNVFQGAKNFLSRVDAVYVVIDYYTYNITGNYSYKGDRTLIFHFPAEDDRYLKMNELLPLCTSLEILGTDEHSLLKNIESFVPPSQLKNIRIGGIRS